MPIDDKDFNSEWLAQQGAIAYEYLNQDQPKEPNVICFRKYITNKQVEYLYED